MIGRCGWIRAAGVFSLWSVAGLLGSCADESWPTRGEASDTPGDVTGEQQSALEVSATLTVGEDTSIRVSAPNKNFGNEPMLDVNRALVKIDPAQLASVVGASDYVISAQLEFTLVDRAERRRQLPRQVGAYRVLKPWTEAGATWLCAIDTNPANARPDCAGTTAWQMLGSGAFVNTPSSTTVVPASRTGVVSFDVTSDVRAFVSGAAANHGWLLKTPVGAILEIAELASAESGSAPRLVLRVQSCSAAACDDGNTCTTDSCDANANCVHSPADGAACDDGNACTDGDRCSAGACAAGTPLPAGSACGAGQVCDGTPAQCMAARVVINEVESSGGSPGDWIELYNEGPSAVDLSRWVLKDNDDTHIYTFPVGTTIAAGAYLAVDESALGYGLGAGDSARLFAPTGAALGLIDAYTWTAHAPTSYGRCPDGNGAFATTTTVTKGAANDCAAAPPDAGVDGGSDAGNALAPWPGPAEVATVDALNAFAGNLSGLTYQPANMSVATPAILWAVQNNPSVLYRLQWNGSTWTSASTDDWTMGKTLVYASGTGVPDSEGVTKAEWESPAIYVATERDNNVSTVSRLSVLRFDTSASGTTLLATHEWNLTSELPAVGANLGLEAITWVSDSYLVASGFVDQRTGQPYDPMQYANHGSGLFFVGVEANGAIHAYALDHAGGVAFRVASFASGQLGTMGLEFDRDQNALWAYCDDTCGNRANLFAVDTTTLSPTRGQFVLRASFERPGAMPNLNNEGIAIAPETECQSGFKSFYWADDSATEGHSLRRGFLPCGPLF